MPKVNSLTSLGVKVWMSVETLPALWIEYSMGNWGHTLEASTKLKSPLKAS